MTGNEIRRVRVELGLDPFAFAKVLGIHVSSLYRWEALGGEVRMDPLQSEVLEQLAKKLRAKRSTEKKKIGASILAGLLMGGTIAGLAALLAFLLTRDDDEK